MPALRLEQAEAELTEAVLAFNRIKELLEDEVASPSEYDAAEARHKSAIAAVAARKGNIAGVQISTK